RQDLYFRLAVLMVDLPPLRSRPADVARLARTLLARTHPGAVLTDAACRVLESWSWPGNVRARRNVLTRAVGLGGPTVAAQALIFQPLAFEGVSRPGARGASAEERERRLILGALDRAGGNRTEAARTLGMPRSSLLYRMKRLGIR